jgi:16S rRNA (cytosine967-C5)-methyltransferase
MSDAPPPFVELPISPDEAARVRPMAARAYADARARAWPFLSDVLEGVLRGASDDDRAATTAAVHALVKYDRLLGFASGSDAVDARYDALLALARGETNLAPRIERIADPTERLGVACSFPDWLVELVRGELGDGGAWEGKVEAALRRMNEPAPRVVRVNTLKTTRDACGAALAAEGVDARPTAHAAQGLIVDGRRSLFRTAAFARGDVEVQDEASQLVAELVAPPPRSFVVDACAGAGGKTLALAALLEGKGKLVAIEPSEGKLEELRRRARRAGASNVQGLALDLRDDSLVERFRGGASRVLVDAPCTGLGAIRRNPEARWRLREGDLSRLVAAQAALTQAAARLVAPHGRLVYATCSFLPSEGEVAIDFFLSQNPDFSLVTTRDVLGRARTDGIATRDGRFLRTWRLDMARTAELDDGAAPDRMDGFFAAVLRRTR